MEGEINQALICINDSNCGNLPIKKGLKYVINDIRVCPTCGMVEFKLSIPYNSIDTKIIVCVTCKTQFEKEICDTWWAEHWRFAPLETKEEKKSNLNVKLEPKKIIKELEIISN